MAQVSAGTISDRALNGAGLSHKEKPGYQFVGYDSSGRKVYGDPKLLSNNINAGKDKVGYVSSLLKTIGVANQKDATTLDYIGAAASDGIFLNNLYQLKQQGDAKGFVNAIAQKLKKPVIAEFKDPQNKAGVRAGFQAWNMFSNWDKMSNAQRSLSVAQLGLDTYEFADGTNLRKKQIIDPVFKGGKVVTPGLNVGQALQLASTGVSVVETVSNWNDLSAMGKVVGGARTVSDVINSAKMMGFIDQNGAVKMNGPQVNAGTAQTGAYSTIGTYANYALGGLGGLAAGAQLYEAWGKGGTNQEKAEATAGAINTGTAAAAQLGSETAKEALPYLNYALTAYHGAKTLFSGDLTPEQKATMMRKQGEDLALGVGTMGVGTLVQAFDRQFLGGQTDKLRSKIDKISPDKIIADKINSKIIGRLTKGQGKNEGQVLRDNVRGQFHQVGLVGKDDYMMALPDGATADFGVDGHGNKHSWSAPDKRMQAEKGRGDLYAYDIDYTNDMDFAAGMGGIALSRMISGGAALPVDQVGGQIGNASLGKVGHGAAFTEDNFNSVMQNQRAIYAKSGIDSAEKMNDVLNLMEAQGRLKGAELAAARQSTVMVFDQDNGYNTARQLMAGRWSGIQALDEIAQGKAEQAERKAIHTKPIEVKPEDVKMPQGATPPVTKDPAPPLKVNGQEMQKL